MVTGCARDCWPMQKFYDFPWPFAIFFGASNYFSENIRWWFWSAACIGENSIHWLFAGQCFCKDLVRCHLDMMKHRYVVNPKFVRENIWSNHENADIIPRLWQYAHWSCLIWPSQKIDWHFTVSRKPIGCHSGEFAYQEICKIIPNAHNKW